MLGIIAVDGNFAAVFLVTAMQFLCFYNLNILFHPFKRTVSRVSHSENRFYISALCEFRGGADNLDLTVLEHDHFIRIF